MEYPPELLAMLAACESRYQSGDRTALFDAIVHCAAYQLPVPEWARYALMSASTARARLEVTDWADIFGDLLPRKTQRLKKLSSAKIDLLGGDIVTAATMAIKAGNSPDWALIAKQVTDAHRERTSEALTLSAGTARDIYYRTRKQMAEVLGAEGARILAGSPKRGRKAR